MLQQLGIYDNQAQLGNSLQQAQMQNCVTHQQDYWGRQCCPQVTYITQTAPAADISITRVSNGYVVEIGGVKHVAKSPVEIAALISADEKARVKK